MSIINRNFISVKQPFAVAFSADSEWQRSEDASSKCRRRPTSGRRRSALQARQEIFNHQFGGKY